MRDSRPPVSPERLAEAEGRLAELGHALPRSYRSLLQEQDGGQPIRDLFSYRQYDFRDENLIRRFLGIGPSPSGDLVESLELNPGRFPAGTVPIALDSNGNFLLLDGRDRRDGPVWFWDHEYETDPPSEENLFWVARDLQSFLDALIEDPEPTQPIAPPKGWRRIFSREQ